MESSVRKNTGAKKAQSALDYLLTYSWALVLAAIVVAALYLIVFSPPQLVPGTCEFNAGLYCQDVVFGTNSVTSSVALLLTNTQEFPIAYPQISVNFSNLKPTNGICVSNIVIQGGAIVCNVSLAQPSLSFSSLVTGKMFVSVIPCPSGVQLQCQNGQRQTYSGSFIAHVTPLLAVVPTSIALTVLNSSQPANGNLDPLTATVKLQGALLGGATVTFTQTNTFAKLAPPETTTAGSGNALSYISSTQSGVTLVTASFAGYSNSVAVTFNAPINVTLQVSPSFCPGSNANVIAIDSRGYACSQLPITTGFGQGSVHTYACISPIPTSTGTRYVYQSVSGCGAGGGSFTVSSACTLTCTYAPQYYLTETAAPPILGTVSPGSNWYNSGTVVTITATPTPPHTFVGWVGTGSGSYTGNLATSSATMNSPITEVGYFKT